MLSVEQKKLPISAIVTGYNEGYILEDCLKSIAFCADIIYVDLQSGDNSRELAQKQGATVIEHQKVPMVEIIHEELQHKTKYDWILTIDPDERLSEEVCLDIKKLFEEGVSNDIGAILVPCVYYYKKHRLIGTRWGGLHSRWLIFHKDRCRMSGVVHAGRTVVEPYKPYFVPFTGKNLDHHYWMLSFKQLREKHQRYLRLEGESRNFMGFIATKKKILKRPLKAFYSCFIKDKGYKDGFYGFMLSCFWAWYDTSAEIKLYKYQKQHNTNK